MRWGSLAALGIALLVVAPVLAHVIRRRRREPLDFAPARLLAAAFAVARRRSRLEDPPLFALRALAVLALAALGASPFVHCSRFALGRSQGGSVGLVLVVDDSLSMQASYGTSTRWEHSVRVARDLVRSAREGDALAIVAAGAPARILLAATTDVSAAADVLATLRPSDRGTDLDGALSLATSLASSMSPPDRRIAVLSDLADGRRNAPPLGAVDSVPVWLPLPDLGARLPDCGIVRAESKAKSVRITVVCGEGSDADHRSVEIVHNGQVLGRVDLDRETTQRKTVLLSEATPTPLQARLTGHDGLAADDQAPVVPENTVRGVAVISDLAPLTAASSRPVLLEQALSSLDDTLSVRPLPLLPDHVEELTPFSALIIDDPPGFAPEVRSALRAWIDRGGVGLVLLGPRAGTAILGATLEPFLSGPVRWLPFAPPLTAPVVLTSRNFSTEAWENLAAQGRAVLETKTTENASVLAQWPDGSPLVLTRSVGKGLLVIATLPANIETSDLAFRPGFLELLDFVLQAAREHGGDPRVAAGAAWVLQPGETPQVQGPTGTAVSLRNQGGVRSVVAAQAGLYTFRFADRRETRVAEIPEREVDLTPRLFTPSSSASAFGSSSSEVDLSSYVAWLLLAVLAAETALRSWYAHRQRRQS